MGWCWWFHISWIIDWFIACFIAGIWLFCVFFLGKAVAVVAIVVVVLVIVTIVFFIADGFWVIVSIVLWLGGIVGIVCVLVCVRHGNGSMQADGARLGIQVVTDSKELPLAQLRGLREDLYCVWWAESLMRRSWTLKNRTFRCRPC